MIEQQLLNDYFILTNRIKELKEAQAKLKKVIVGRLKKEEEIQEGQITAKLIFKSTSTPTWDKIQKYLGDQTAYELRELIPAKSSTTLVVKLNTDYCN